MKTYLALVRHGVTDWNYDGRAQGQVDVPLNAEGERQAEAVAARMATERWDAVYSSDLARARATAEAICRRTGHTLVTDRRLRERDMGPAEGLTAVEREVLWPGVALSDIPGVESDAELGRRAEAILTEIARRHPGQRVIVVSHGALLNRFLQQTVKAKPVNFRNTGISPVVWDGEAFHPAGGHDYRHLLVDGVEYDGVPDPPGPLCAAGRAARRGDAAGGGPRACCATRPPWRRPGWTSGWWASCAPSPTGSGTATSTCCTRRRGTAGWRR